MPLKIIGDGLAGLLLARALKKSAIPFTLYGQRESNTPPIALVHLFAGRSFKRDVVEVQAFERAIHHWDQEDLAQKMTVKRHIKAGGRLARSLKNTVVPQSFKPQVVDESWVKYSPGYAIQTHELEKRLRAELADDIRYERLTSLKPGARHILACGTGIDTFIDAPWQKPGGRVVMIAHQNLDAISIGHGAHLAPNGSWAAIGGRFTPTGEILGDELECAEKLVGETYKVGRIWSGNRCLIQDDRWPVIGWFNQKTFIFSGFGSRALFWLPYAVELAEDALKRGDNGAIPPRLGPERLGDKLRIHP